MEEVTAAREAALKSQPQEITEDAFWDALEALPPQGWSNCGHTESFKFSEHLSGRITSIFARIGTRYFTYNDLCTVTHQEIVAKLNSVTNQPAAQATT